MSDAIEDLKALAENWVWKEDNLNLVLAGIGSPEELVANLKTGVFRPYVSERAKQRRVRILNVERGFRRDLLSEVGSDLTNLTDLVVWEDTENVTVDNIVIGEIPIVDFDAESEKEVISQLEQYCQDIVARGETKDTATHGESQRSLFFGQQHRNVEYPCEHCDYEEKYKGCLKIHID